MDLKQLLLMVWNFISKHFVTAIISLPVGA